MKPYTQASANANANANANTYTHICKISTFLSTTHAYLVRIIFNHSSQRNFPCEENTRTRTHIRTGIDVVSPYTIHWTSSHKYIWYIHVFGSINHWKNAKTKPKKNEIMKMLSILLYIYYYINDSRKQHVGSDFIKWL